MLLSLVSLVLAVASTTLADVRDVWATDSVYPVAIERLDPIVNPNAVSSHTHRVFGASNFGASYNFAEYQASTCTSIGPQADKSAYWVPQLYWMDKDSSGNPIYAAIDGNVRIYYNLWRDVDAVPIRPFPPGLRMLVGNPNSKQPVANLTHTFVCQVGTDLSQNINGAHFNFNSTCVQGVKAQLNFPPCWDGINLYKADQSHMAYPAPGRSFFGACPTTHPFRVPGIQFEIIFRPSNVPIAKGKNVAGHLIWANGDTTGYGWHGDFVNGWDFDVLKNALTDNRCVRAGLSGSTASSPMSMQSCPILGASQDDAKAKACTVAQGKGLMKEQNSQADLVQIPALPGCNLPWGATGTKPTCANTPFIPDVTPFKGTDGPLVADAAYRLDNSLPTSGGWKNLYCVAGSSIPLTNQINWNDPSLTATRCQDNCLATDYRYSAVTPDQKCMCGDGIRDGTQNKPGECTSKCIGNSTEFCGAPSRSSISYAPPNNQFPSGVSRGCYVPPFNENDGFKGVILYTVSAAVTTPQSCINTCSSRGYKWAATQNGDVCNCGNTWRPATGHFTVAKQNICSTPCKGDTSQMCGQTGTYNMMIYDLTKGTSIGSGGGVSSAIASTASGVSSKPATATTAVATGSKTSTSAAAASSSAAAAAAQYAGCWAAPGPKDGLRNYTFTNNAMTQSMCTTACASLSYAYAGLQNGNNCLCGDENFSTYQQLDSACNKACGGAASTTCGSAFNMQLYSVSGISGDAASDPPGFAGCYADPNHNGGGAPYRIKPANLTVEMCVGGCKELNYTVASMTQGNLCMCSNKWGGGQKLPENQCTGAPCVGNLKESCGSGTAAVVYDTTIGKAAPAMPASWLGCWAGTPVSTFSYTASDMTPDVCRSTCKVRGYSLAGLSNGNACKCGNANAALTRNPHFMCNLPCYGNSSDTCGGSGFTELYDATSVPAPVSLVAGYLGCYSDTATFNVNALTSDFMTNQICGQRCAQMGYTYSGMQAANCKCSNNKPLTAAAESGCSYACTGDTNQICGGYRGVSAYLASTAQSATVSDTSGIPKSNVTYPGYLGCWNELNSVLVLPATVLQSNTMTLDMCVANCKSGGYKYAGLQSGKRCYCDNTITGSDPRVRDAWCKLPCPGNAAQICGSDGKMSLFDVAKASAGTGGTGTSNTSKSSTSVKPSSSTLAKSTTTIKPVSSSTTVKPATTTSKPATTTAKPATTTAKPATTTSKPATTTSKRATTTVKPTTTIANKAAANFVIGGSLAEGSNNNDEEEEATESYQSSDYSYAASGSSGSVVKPADVMVEMNAGGKNAVETVIRYVTVTAGVSEPTKRSHRHRGISSRSRAGLRAHQV